MHIVIDTNIIFSILLNPKSNLGYVFFNLLGDLEFIAPKLLTQELIKYKDKLIRYSKLDENDMDKALQSLLKNIKFYSTSDIPLTILQTSEDILKDIDIADRDFLALALMKDCLLWTGDNKLSQGLKNKGYDITINTDRLISMLLSDDQIN